MPEAKTDHRFAAVILAGGSGTRFWPRSRRACAKQVLALDGERTMIQQTVARLEGIASATDVWVITNDLLAEKIAEQLPETKNEQILREPAARNTAPACALAAFLLERKSPETVLGIFPSDHTIGNISRFQQILQAGIELAAAGDNIVVLGVPPTRPETGYGYIELGAACTPAMVNCESIPVRRVRRFTEKPNRERARTFLRSGRYAWNSGMFLWSARTLTAAVREHSPDMAPLLERIAGAWGTAEFEKTFAELYPQCETSRSIMRFWSRGRPRARRARICTVCRRILHGTIWARGRRCTSFVAEGKEMHNVVDAQDHVEISSSGSYVYAPGKTVALVGVKDIVVVETEDAILMTTREGSQDVGRVVAS